MLKQKIEADLKEALRTGDAIRLSVLRMVKNSITYAEVDSRSGLQEKDLLQILRKEAKQRQDSADIYEKASAFDRRDQELAEKAIIEEYLPSQLSDSELAREADAVIAEIGPLSPQTMGKIIGAIKERVGGQAEGGRIASYVKERLYKEN